MLILLEGLAALALLAILAELGLRAYYRVLPAPRCFRATSDREGIAFRFNCRCVYECRGQVTTLSTDADGHRLVPGSPSEPQPHTVHLVGDSQACGWGLSDEHTIAAHLQQLLGAGWKVINRAIPMVGPHTYRELLETIPLDDIVLLLASDDSDLIESRPDRPAIFVRCGFLLPKNWHGKHIPCWLTRSFCFHTAVKWRRSLRPPEWPVPINFHPSLKQRARELAAALEASYGPHRAARGVRMICSVVPWEVAIVPSRGSRFRPRLVKPERFAAMPEDVDLHAPFLRHPRPETLYHRDHHLTEAGARLAAEQLAPALRAAAATSATGQRASN